MTQSVTNQLDQLRTLSRQQLLDLWQELYDRAAPGGLRRELLIPFLAYRIQEKTYGGLKPSTRGELRRIVQEIEPGGGPRKRLVQPRIKPGTRIVRTWRGAAHEIFVAESGFEYHGAIYNSLSEIARKITGTRWSGPAFFKLQKGRSEQSHDDIE